EVDVTRVGAVGVDAGEHLHQRRLACAVLAADRVHLPALHREGDVLERLDAWEGLRDTAHLENVAVRGHVLVLVLEISVCRGGAGCPAPAGGVRLPRRHGPWWTAGSG